MAEFDERSAILQSRYDFCDFLHFCCQHRPDRSPRSILRAHLLKGAHKAERQAERVGYQRVVFWNAAFNQVDGICDTQRGLIEPLEKIRQILICSPRPTHEVAHPPIAQLQREQVVIEDDGLVGSGTNMPGFLIAGGSCLPPPEVFAEAGWLEGRSSTGRFSRW